MDRSYSRQELGQLLEQTEYGASIGQLLPSIELLAGPHTRRSLYLLSAAHNVAKDIAQSIAKAPRPPLSMICMGDRHKTAGGRRKGGGRLAEYDMIAW